MSAGIAYQNKDILFKVLSDEYKSKTFKVYGLDLPPIKEVLSPNLPAVKADELRGDNMFLLEDDSLLIIDYKSTASRQDLFQCGFYGFRAVDSYFKGEERKLTLVVIYTGNVTDAPAQLDMDSILITVKQVFLSKFDGDAIYEELRRKVTAGETLSDEDVMRFIILPLTDKSGSQARVEAAVELAKEIKDERLQIFIVAGILTATDKFIDREYADKVKEWMRMTKVARLYEEEKIEAVNTAVAQVTAQMTAQAAAAAAQAVEQERRKSLRIAKNLLEDGVDILLIMKATGLTRKEIESGEDGMSA